MQSEFQMFKTKLVKSRKNEIPHRILSLFSRIQANLLLLQLRLQLLLLQLPRRRKKRKRSLKKKTMTWDSVSLTKYRVSNFSISKSFLIVFFVKRIIGPFMKKTERNKVIYNNESLMCLKNPVSRVTARNI